MFVVKFINTAEIRPVLVCRRGGGGRKGILYEQILKLGTLERFFGLSFVNKYNIYLLPTLRHEKLALCPKSRLIRNLGKHLKGFMQIYAY